METKFAQFLRNGGNGEFVIRRAGDVWLGTRTDLAGKSEFPHYTSLRDAFATSLDTVIQQNTAMLLKAIAAFYDPPLIADDLPDVSRPRADMLAEWEQRIEVIWTEWHSHPWAPAPDP